MLPNLSAGGRCGVARATGRLVAPPLISASTRTSSGGRAAASQAGVLRIAKTIIYRKENRIALDPIVADNQRAKVAVVWWGPLHQRGGRLVPIELTSGTSYSTCASLRSRWFKIGSGPGMIRAIFLSFKQVSIRAGDHGFYHSHIHSCLCTAFCIPFGERDKDAQAREGRFGVRRQRGR